MLIKYDEVELQSSILNSIFAAFITSPYDPSLVADALDTGEEVNRYQDMRREYHDENACHYRVAHVFRYWHLVRK